jgi:alpha-D-ribose 1-methylphosphonate 5-phosphate C-P lyase
VEDFTDESGNRRACKRCGCTSSFLDEFVDSRSGEKVYQCSDADWCNEHLGTVRMEESVTNTSGTARRSGKDVING